jgi:polyferredoxin
MDKLKRPRGLIRYSSQAAMEGEKPKLLRPRVVIYPTVLVIIATLFVLVLRGTGKADVTIVRGMGQPFVVNATGEVQNMLKVKIVNRAESSSTFHVALVDEPTGRIELEKPDILVQPGEMLTVPVRAILPADAFPKPQHPVKILVTGPDGYSKTISMTMLGPVHKQHKNPAPGQKPQSPTNAEPAGGTP